jgi:hypothetical protein
MAFDTPYHNKKRRFENGSKKGIKMRRLYVIKTLEKI